MHMTPEEVSALEKLERMIESHPLLNLSEDEVAAIRRVIAREKAYMALGVLAGNVRGVLTWLGVIVGAWISVKAGFLEWLAKELGR